MPFSPQSFEEKPYNMCIDCKYIGKKCDGPNFLAMDTDRWCEWCKLRKEYLGWTNAYVAEKAGVSKISVDRVMSGNVKDLRISTMQAITKVLVNGSWGQYPCAMAELSEPETVYVDNPNLVAECNKLKEQMEASHEEEKQRDKLFEKLLDERADYLRRKDRYIAILAILLAIAVSVIIFALVVDALNSDIGFFWFENAAAYFKNHTNSGLQNAITGWKL